MSDETATQQVDLRSDTVTTPTPRMRRAMASAEVGDDVYGEDPTVTRLEAHLASMAGFEAGLFVPSGTMANQVALAVHARPGTEVLMPAGAHIYEFEPGAMAVIAGVLPRLLEAPLGAPALGDVRAALSRSTHQAPISLLALENTHNAAGGTVLRPELQAELLEVANSAGISTHLDGARAFNAATYLKIGLAELLKGFVSVSVCLSKGLGAPIGSVLLGNGEFIAEARRWRKLLGGGMRQVGVLAAAGLVALEEGPARLGADHARARHLAKELNQLPGLAVDLKSVQTNIVYVNVAGEDGAASESSAKALAAACAARGVLFNALGGGRVRLVTHFQLTDEDISRAVNVLTEENEGLREAHATPLPLSGAAGA